jgi:hypothetical protein
VAEPATSRERIRAAALACLAAECKHRSPEAIADDEAFAARLTARIDEALRAAPGQWVGPQLTAADLEELRLDHYQPLTDALRHIDCQSATIRNQNDIMAALRNRVAELEGEPQWLRAERAERRADLDVAEPEQVVVLARSEHEALVGEKVVLAAQLLEAEVELRRLRGELVLLADRPANG